jgi:alginate O-acetyltransferase complex protein AlgI
MFGLGSAQAGADLLAGIMYQPYYVGVFALAAVVVWVAPQTWDFSRSITPVKAAITVTVMWLSMALLFTQSFNPFIYFIF